MRSSWLGGWTALLTLVLTGPGCRCTGGGVGDRCSDNADCDPGLYCEPGTLTCAAGADGGGGGDAQADAGGTPDASAALDAGTDAKIAEDAGRPDSGPPPLGETGAPCMRDVECAPAMSAGATPFCIPELFGFPGGYCSNNTCDPGTTGECPGADALCLGDAAAGDSNCVDGCVTDADCRPGYDCFDTGLLGGMPGGPLACLPFCVDGSDCDAGQSCDATSFTCYTTGSSIGDPCTANADCPMGAVCIGEALLGFPGGYCFAECDPTGGGACPTGGTCYGTDPMDATAGSCFLDCTPGPGGGTCARAGYACSDALPYGGMLSDPACVPDCSADSDCTEPAFGCEEVIGLCQPPALTFGEACDDQSGCVGGICLDEASSGEPFGLCHDECDPTMSIPGDCPAGGTCIDVSGFAGGTLGLCYPSCDPAMPDCRDGYECTTFPLTTDEVCLANCTASSQCESGCCALNLFGGSCVDPAGTPPPSCL